MAVFKNSLVKNSILFICATIINMTIVFFLVSDLVEMPGTIGMMVLNFFTLIVFSILVWYGWTEGDWNDSSTLKLLFILCIVGLTSIIENHNVNGLFFRDHFYWIDLLVWTICGAVIYFESQDDLLSDITSILFASWLIITIHVSVGNGILFSYSNKALIEVRAISVFLDLRLTLGILLLAFLVIKSLLIAIKIQRPDFSKIIVIQYNVKLKNVIFDAVISTFLIVLNSIISGIVLVINSFWILIATISFYLFHTGIEIGKCIILLFSNSFELLRLIILSIVLTFVCDVSQSMTSDTLLYLNSGVLIEGLSYFTTIFVCFVLLVLSLILIVFIFSLDTSGSITTVYFKSDIFEKNLRFRMSGITIALLIFWLSGLVLWLLSNIGGLSIIGFRSIGFYTFLLSVIVFFGLVFSLVRHKSITVK